MNEFETDLKVLMAKHKITSALCSFVVDHKDNVVIAMSNDEIDIIITGLSLLIANATDIFVVQNQVILSIFVEKFLEMKNKHATERGGNILDNFDVGNVKPS